MDEKQSKELQEEMTRLAEVLWAGRDDDTARLLREGARAMRALREHDELLQRSAESEEPVTAFITALEEIRQKIAKAVKIRSDAPWQMLVPVIEQMSSAIDTSMPGAVVAKSELWAIFQEAGFVDCTLGKLDWTNIVGAARVLTRDVVHWKSECKKALAENTTLSKQLLEKESQLRGYTDSEKLKKCEDKISHLSAHLEASNSEREAVLIAVGAVRDTIVKCSQLVTDALGEKTGDEEKRASTLPGKIRILVSRLEERKKEIAHLNKEIARYRLNDETLATSWKGHVWRVAAALGTPRPVMGVATDPNIDQIMQYINQTVAPMLMLSKRVERIEAQLQEPPTKPKSQETECPKCGWRYAAGAAFCPHCGVEPEPNS